MSFLLLDSVDPRRQPALTNLTLSIVNTRLQTSWLYIYMRNRVDRFLSACEGAGLLSPAQLPPLGSSMVNENPMIQNLLYERYRLNTDLCQISASFPTEIREALFHGSASALIAAYLPASGSSVHTFNTITFPSWICCG